MKRCARALALTLLLAPAAARAGVPFLTDDAGATESGHLEIYGPLFETEGRGSDFEGALATEINFGLAPGLQLSAEIPVAFAHDRSGTRWGTGDIGVSAKYQFYRDEHAGLAIAAFPALTLPTASNGMGNRKVTALLPLWIQKDAGPWSFFGGGGYAINPGSGNRDYWTGGLAVTHQLTRRLLLGVEATRQGADAANGAGSTRLGVGGIYQLGAPFRLLASGGPTFEDGRPGAGFHAFLALGLDL